MQLLQALTCSMDGCFPVSSGGGGRTKAWVRDRPGEPARLGELD